jgi:hypothetical protein
LASPSSWLRKTAFGFAIAVILALSPASTLGLASHDRLWLHHRPVILASAPASTLALTLEDRLRLRLRHHHGFGFGVNFGSDFGPNRFGLALPLSLFRLRQLQLQLGFARLRRLGFTAVFISAASTSAPASAWLR